MRTALALAVAVTLAAGCGSGDDPPVPPCRSEAVFVQQVPKLGLSKIEDLPATPEQVRLDPNPALIDGALDGSAGVDLGSGRTLAGDHHLRDIGAEFADPTVVNRVDVHVDRALPPDVAATLTWTAYRSDDNQTWTEVQLVGSVQFGTFVNRFEIPIAGGPSRYVKVVTQPLPASVDPGFEIVFGTEVMVLALQWTTTCTP